MGWVDQSVCFRIKIKSNFLNNEQVRDLIKIKTSKQQNKKKTNKTNKTNK